MQRFQSLTVETAPEASRTLLQAAESKFGKIPNLLATMANSPAALQGFFAISGALESSSLSPAFFEKVSLAVAEFNQCDYCLSAHTTIAKMQGLTDEQTIQARQGVSIDAKEQAALRFVIKVLETKGAVSDTDVEELRTAGYDDQQIADILSATIKDIMTNYFNKVMASTIDWPLAPQLAHA